jgi:hypothetical protein
MISKREFEKRFRAFLTNYDLSLSQASAILRISNLRAHLYLTGWFRFNPGRESAVLNLMSNYILLQKLRNAWQLRSNGMAER